MLITLGHKVAALPYLNVLALRYIYEKETLSAKEIDLLMTSVIKWNKKADLTEDELTYLQYICSLLDKNEKGKFNERKENFKKHNIDWRAFHRLPVKRYGTLEGKVESDLIATPT